MERSELNMGSKNPLPYMNGWVLIIVSFSLFYLAAKFGSPIQCSPTPGCVTPPTSFPASLLYFVYAAATAIAGTFPAPFNGFLSSGVLVLAGGLTLGLKLLDAPLGSGRRFKKLEGEVAKNPKVKNPAAVAASVGRAKYGKARFQRLSIRGRRRRQ
jgi:hypothetical protein